MNPMKKYQRITVVFLLLIGIVNYLDRSALSIANTSIQKDMMISPSQMGILLSAFSIAYAFAQLPMGMIIDRLGSKIALGASLLGWSVARLRSAWSAVLPVSWACGYCWGLARRRCSRRPPRLCRSGSMPTNAARQPAWCGRRPALVPVWHRRC